MPLPDQIGQQLAAAGQVARHGVHGVQHRVPPGGDFACQILAAAEKLPDRAQQRVPEYRGGAVLSCAHVQDYGCARQCWGESQLGRPRLQGVRVHHLGVIQGYVPEEVVDRLLAQQPRAEQRRLLEQELALPLHDQAATGYLIGQERHIDPARLTAGLAGLARKAGAEIWEQAEVRRLDIAARQVRAVVTDNGPLPVAGVILAGGASCGALLRPLGIRLPLTAGKGYSFLRRLRSLPRRPIHLGDIKVAVTPFARGLRVAGTMELSGNNETLRRSRAEAIARGTAQYFDGWDELEPGSNGREPEELWVGRRPLTPDGLPILDRVHPFENLFIATGHSMLGVTLAPASGKALAGYVLSGQRPELLEPFRLRRFASTS